MDRSILSQIKQAIRSGLEDKASQIIKSNGNYLSKRDLISLITYMEQIKTYSIGVVRYIYYVSPYRHEFCQNRFNVYTTLRHAGGANYSNIVSMMLSDVSVFSEFSDIDGTLNFAAQLILSSGESDTILSLLKCNKISTIPGMASDALDRACMKGYVDIVRFLLNSHLAQSIIPYQYIYAFRTACVYGHLTIVSMFLKSGMDLSDDGMAFESACSRGDIEIVKLLLTYQQTDPANHSNRAIAAACYSKNADIVRLLLEDERVYPDQKPSSKQGITFRKPIHEALTVEIVELLMDDGRIDPSSDGNYALQHMLQICVASNDVNAYAEDIQKYISIIVLLLTDRRVVEAGLDEEIDLAKTHGLSFIVHLLEDANQKILKHNAPQPYLSI